MGAAESMHLGAGRASRPALVLTHADRWSWRPPLDPARCPHAVRGFFAGTPERLTKYCGGCGAVLAEDLARCPATNRRSNRQCRLPVRTDRGYTTCAAHRRAALPAEPLRLPAHAPRLFGGPSPGGQGWRPERAHPPGDEVGP